MRIYVGNFPRNTTEQDLFEWFSLHGEVSETEVCRDDYHATKGFGFVEMPDANDANKAILALHGAVTDGRKLTVERARAARLHIPELHRSALIR